MSRTAKCPEWLSVLIRTHPAMRVVHGRMLAAGYILASHRGTRRVACTYRKGKDEYTVRVTRQAANAVRERRNEGAVS